MHDAAVFDWNDLRHLLAVAQHGSMLAAARALRVDQSTVQRRLAELERCLGQRLVQREAAGYQLTEFGQAMLPHAQRVADAVAALEQRVEAERRAAVGVVRVTCPEPIVVRLSAAGLIQRFHDRYPGLHVEFVMSDRYLDLTRGEADVALRSGDTDDGALVGRKIGDSLWAVYACRSYAERQGGRWRTEELSHHPMIGFSGALSGHRAARWLAEAVPDARIVARNDSVLGLVQSVKAGIGIAALPTALGDAEADLVRVLGPIPELTRIWRVLTTAELRRTPRVAAFFDYIVEQVEALRPVITG
jgi:DNA-binding transcriptional LysR family regulator